MPGANRVFLLRLTIIYARGCKIFPLVTGRKEMILLQKHWGFQCQIPGSFWVFPLAMGGSIVSHAVGIPSPWAVQIPEVLSDGPNGRQWVWSFGIQIPLAMGGSNCGSSWGIPSPWAVKIPEVLSDGPPGRQWVWSFGIQIPLAMGGSNCGSSWGIPSPWAVQIPEVLSDGPPGRPWVPSSGIQIFLVMALHHSETEIRKSYVAVSIQETEWWTH
jgi:hypothetical protein